MKIKMHGGLTAIEQCAKVVGATFENVRLSGGYVQGVFRPTKATPDKFRKVSHRGRRVHAVSFIGHFEIMMKIFLVDSKAIIKTALATYNGFDEFKEKWQTVGQTNVGSLIQPRLAIMDNKPPKPIDEHRVTFGTLTPSGLTNVREIRQLDIQKCPHVILDAEHYRPDGTCKCSNAEHREMMIREWGYSEKDFEGTPLID